MTHLGRHLPRLRASSPHRHAVSAPPGPLESAEKQECISGAWQTILPSPARSRLRPQRSRAKFFTPAVCSGEKGGKTWSSLHHRSPGPGTEETSVWSLEAPRSNLMPGKHSPKSLWLWLPREAVFPASRGAGPPPRDPGPPSACHRARAEGQQGSQGMSWHHLAHWTGWKTL